MLKKLRGKFICINMLIVTVMLAVIFCVLYYFTENNLRNESIDMMQSVANSSSYSFLTPYDQSEQIRLPYFTLQITPLGRVIASGNGYYDLTDEDFLTELVNDVYNQADTTGIISQYKLRYYRCTGLTGQIIVFADMSSELATLHNLVRVCLIVGLLAFLVFGGISFLLARWAVRPVEQAWKQQRQFVADASHELKTPLTVITTNAELLQQASWGEESRGRFTDSILTMSRQMRSLVESLLELARADNGQSRRAFEALDMSKLTLNALLPFEPLMFERGLSFSSDIRENIHVKGNEQQLKQLIDILLDNAQKYAADSGYVHVSLAPAGHSRCRLTVANAGETIAPADLKNIFKRFYRVDPARSRDGSFGLGLSIAQSIVSDHGGRIWAESKSGINSFIVELPAA